jgi:DNA-binding NarL/FixJ family response regulator
VTVDKYFTRRGIFNYDFTARSDKGNHLAKIRVVVADAHQEIIASVRGILGEEFEIVAAVEDGNQAVRAVLALDPDVFVTNISMPILDGIQAAREIQKANRRVEVIFLTIHQDGDYVAAAFTAGASGYVTKPRLSPELLLAIHEVMMGRTFVSKSMAI